MAFLFLRALWRLLCICVFPLLPPRCGWPRGGRGRGRGGSGRCHRVLCLQQVGLLPSSTLTQATGQTLHSHVRVLPERAAEADGVVAGHAAGRQGHGAVLHRKSRLVPAGGPGRGGRGALGTGGRTAVPCQGPLFWSALLLRRVVRARSGRRVKPVSPGRADAGAGRSLPGAGPGARSLAVGSSCSHWEPGKAMY